MVNVAKIIAYENGELDERESVELFSDLISSGAAWELQGGYGRAASWLIEAGYLDPSGTVNPDTLEKAREGAP